MNYETIRNESFFSTSSQFNKYMRTSFNLRVVNLKYKYAVAYLLTIAWGRRRYLLSNSLLLPIKYFKLI